MEFCEQPSCSGSINSGRNRVCGSTRHRLPRTGDKGCRSAGRGGEMTGILSLSGAAITVGQPSGDASKFLAQ